MLSADISFVVTLFLYIFCGTDWRSVTTSFADLLCRRESSCVSLISVPLIASVLTLMASVSIFFSVCPGFSYVHCFSFGIFLFVSARK